MSRTRHRLPDNLNPTDDICYPLFVPNDPQWISYLHRQIRTLTFDRHWERDEVNGANAIAVRERWNESTYLPFIDALFNNEPCADESGLGQCFRMDTTTDAFTFKPNDPFTDPQNALGSPILSQLKWKRFAEVGLNSLPFIGDLSQSVLETITGYFPNDIVLTFDLPNLLNPIDRLGDFIGQFTQFPFPFVRIDLEGTGQMEIELLNFPYGCIVMLVPDLPVDENLNIDFGEAFETIIGFIDDGLDLPKGWISLELNRALPIELVVSVIQEFDFDEEGSHTLHAFFIPRPSLLPPFLNPLGGIREIEVCGNLTIIGASTGNEIDKENFGLEENNREGFIMATIEDICNGVYEGMRKYHSGAISGVPSNLLGSITLNADGTTTISSDNGAGLDFNNTSSLRQQMAEWESVESGFEDFLSELNALYAQYGIGSTDDDSLLGGTAFWASLSVQFDLDGEVIDGQSTELSRLIWQFRDIAELGNTLPTSLNDLDRVMFCRGASQSVLASHIFNDGLAYDFLRTELLSVISSAQIDQWKRDAVGKVSDDYVNTTCFRLPNQTLNYPTPAAITFDGPTIKQPISSVLTGLDNSQIELLVSGKLTDPDGDTWDGYYFVPNGGNPIYTPIIMSRSNGSYNKNPDTQPLYKANQNASNPYSAVYSYANNIDRFQVATGLNQIGSLTGSLTIVFIDRGSL